MWQDTRVARPQNRRGPRGRAAVVGMVGQQALSGGSAPNDLAATKLAPILRCTDAAVADRGAFFTARNFSFLSQTRSGAQARQALPDGDMCSSDRIRLIWPAYRMGTGMPWQINFATRRSRLI